MTPSQTKTLVITGASKGIGLATARLFLEEGYDVLNLSRTAPPDPRIHHYSIDLKSPESEELLRNLFHNEWGEPRNAEEIRKADLPKSEQQEICLVHNAAELRKDTIQSCSPEELRQVLELNVLAPHLLSRLLLPYMGAGSSLLFIGSTLSEKAVPGTYSYVTSKHAVVGMMRSVCQDLAGRQIHTAVICPGFTNTEMLRAHVGNNPEVLASIAGLSTFGRLIEPEEIARLVLFTAQNPVLNGAVLHSNLGQKET